MIIQELRRGSGDIIVIIAGDAGALRELAGLADALDGDPRVIALIAPPRGGDGCLEAIRSHQPKGPYHLLGHSTAGAVALETARRLGAAGARVGFVGLVGAPASGLTRGRRSAYVYDGPVTLFATEDDSGRPPIDRWRRRLPRLEVRCVPSVHADDRVARLAEAIDYGLRAAALPRLHVLVAATFDWSGAARLAVELHASGCTVDAVAPNGSALHRIAAVSASHVLDLARPDRSLRRALEASSADLVIPFDDRMRRALHRLYDDADPATEAGARMRSRLETSLGRAARNPSLYSRAAMMNLAIANGVRCPPTAAVESPDDIRQWLRRHPAPAVLKTDGSWGGRETRVLREEADVKKAWRQLSRPPHIARCVKRLLVERDSWPLRARIRRYRPRLSIQSFVEGRDGNAAVACFNGEVLGIVGAEVVRSKGSTGPSTVLRVVEHPEMLAAARGVVGALGLSGLVGLDFVLERDTGHAHLIEVNPRATPTAHLISADGVDLLSALRSALGYGGPPPRTASYPDGLVALFPQELERDSSSEILRHALHDVPWHAPDLVTQALAGVSASAANDMRVLLAQTDPSIRRPIRLTSWTHRRT